ncbi:MAG: PilT/PilU family type 4a pilus ATPase [bacterium]|nr:PilT/PilU family type 4a pilus ATPase [bacterium]
MGEYFDIVNFLKSAVVSGASDEHLRVGYAPFIRKNGFIKKTNSTVLTKEMLDDIVVRIAPASLKNSILSMKDVDFAYEIQGSSRFRVNYSRLLGLPSLVIRNLSYKIPSIEELNLPPILQNILKQHSGLVLVTGPTGSGKSTTLASLINRICVENSKHVITIEDPVEYVFNSSRSIVSQRQIGVDTESFADGIKYALRQDPDIILIGEIRDNITMEAALKASETGHLVFSTLHTSDAVQTINRVINMFDEQSRNTIRKQLADTLRATVAQKLIYSEKKQERYPACEVMVVTSTIRDYIIKNNTEEIYKLLGDTSVDNMFSLNKSLADLVVNNYISEKEALENSNDPGELEKIFRGVFQGTKSYYD